MKKTAMIKPGGQGCTIIECDGIDIQAPENEKIWKNLVSNAKQIRGEIISQSLDVEFYLEKLIGWYFFGFHAEKQVIFEECILHKEFFTFSDKMNTLRCLLTKDAERFQLESVSGKENIIPEIQDIMECRNKITHEEITVNFKERVAYIWIEEKNKKKYPKRNLLSSEYFSQFQGQMFFLNKTFSTLFEHLATQSVKEFNQFPERFSQ